MANAHAEHVIRVQNKGTPLLNDFLLGSRLSHMIQWERDGSRACVKSVQTREQHYSMNFCWGPAKLSHMIQCERDNKYMYSCY